MRRTPLLLATAACSSLLLAGCGVAGNSGDAAAPVSVAPAAATDDTTALADGLLPAADFAPGAQVVPVTAGQLRDALAGAIGPRTGGTAADIGTVTITPDGCVTALQAARTALGDPAAVQDAAGQVARSGFAGTAELLTVGGPVAQVVPTLADAVAACPTATVSTGQGQAVVSFGAPSTPALGDAALVLPVSATLTRAGGAPVTGSALLGVVQDGDRLLTLVSGAVVGAPDAGTFDRLLAAAQQHAADTLD